MLVGHRWEHDDAFREYYCASLPLGGVESHQWCVGCNCRISNLELYNSRLPVDDTCFLHISLDMLARRKGYEPIEAGTFAELKLRRGV